MRFLEIGCAPGCTLAYVHKKCGADVAGLDESPIGVERTVRTLRNKNVRGDIRCEDVFHTTFREGTFDVVYSCGVIEHYVHPGALVRAHVLLLKPGGTAVITVPNFAGVYGKVAANTDAENLAIHNLSIMSPEALRALAPLEMCSSITARPFGRVSLSFVSFKRKRLGIACKAVVNLMGLLQPLEIPALCPGLILRIKRRP